MNKWRVAWLAIFSLLGLTLFACANKQVDIRPVWQNHQQIAMGITAWRLTAAISGVREAINDIPRETFQADIEWHHDNGISDIYLLDFFGNIHGEYHVDFNAQAANYLRLSSRRQLIGDAAIDAFIFRRTGLTQRYVAFLHAWIRALAKNTQYAQVTENNRGQLLAISEFGTHIKYAQFTFVNSRYVLPSMLTIRNQMVALTMHVQWSQINNI